MTRKRIAAAGDDDRAVLEALRARVVAELDGATNRHVVASLSPQQLVRVTATLNDLKLPVGSRVNEIAEQRRRRRAAAGVVEKKPG